MPMTHANYHRSINRFTRPATHQIPPSLSSDLDIDFVSAGNFTQNYYDSSGQYPEKPNHYSGKSRNYMSGSREVGGQ